MVPISLPSSQRGVKIASSAGCLNSRWLNLT